MMIDRTWHEQDVEPADETVAFHLVRRRGGKN